MRTANFLAWLTLIPIIGTAAESTTEAPPAPVSAASQSQREELSKQLREALQAGDFPLARERGVKYVQFLEQLLGADSPELISPLANLSAAMLELGDNSGARQNLSRALVLLDRQTPDKPLVRARLLTLEGRALLRDGQPSQAADSLRKAVAVVEANPSIDAQTKAQVYEALLDSFIAGRAASVGGGLDRLIFDGNLAAKAEITALESQFGADSAQLGVALAGPARWYRFSGQRDAELELHKRAIGLIEKEGGPTDPRLGEPLRGIVSVSLRNRDNREEAEDAVKQALGLRDNGSAKATLARAETIALGGDVDLLFGEPSAAQPDYVEAWKVMAQHPGLGVEMANRFFEEPLRIFAEPVWSAKGGVTGSRLREDTGAVRVTFTVTNLGTAAEMQIVSATANTDWDKALRESEAQIRYRPRLVDGKPVETPDMEISWAFR